MASFLLPLFRLDPLRILLKQVGCVHSLQSVDTIRPSSFRCCMCALAARTVWCFALYLLCSLLLQVPASLPVSAFGISGLNERQTHFDVDLSQAEQLVHFVIRFLFFFRSLFPRSLGWSALLFQAPESLPVCHNKQIVYLRLKSVMRCLPFATRVASNVLVCRISRTYFRPFFVCLPVLHEKKERKSVLDTCFTFNRQPFLI